MGFIVQLSKWLNLRLAVEPIVFSKCLYPFPVICLGVERNAVRENDTWKGEVGVVSVCQTLCA